MNEDEPPRRRAPRPHERRRDAGRTRTKILDAAVAEFGAKGFAGARVADIAARAGVNVQLISYYFGGKAGLYEELNARWRTISAQLTAPASFAEVVAGFARASVEYRDWSRLMVWDELTGPPEPKAPSEQPADEPDMLVAAVDDLHARQRSGELPAELDPAHLLLALFAAACAPVVLPRMARRICDTDPTTPEFGRRYADSLAQIVRLLRPAVD